MDLFGEEILDLWRSLHKHDVKYIMIGGFAVNLYGYTRMTADVDIWIKDTLENRKNLRAALNDAGLGDMEEIERMEFIPGWSSLYLNSLFQLDIMTAIKGFEQVKFDECYALASTADILNVPVKFLHYNQLIAEKRASGRPKDLLDIEELEKIKKGGL